MRKLCKFESTDCGLAVLVALSIGHPLSTIEVDKENVTVGGLKWDPLNDPLVWGPILVRYEPDLAGRLYNEYITAASDYISVLEIRFDRRKTTFVRRLLLEVCKLNQDGALSTDTLKTFSHEIIRCVEGRTEDTVGVVL